MKIMAGYDTRSKVDYRAKAAEEVAKIQAKAKLLEERLAEFKPGDKMTDGDVFEELASSLQSAQPKIQKMCEEESDDHEAVARLFEINDSIHRTVERYKLMKNGDLEGASKIAKGEHMASSAAVKSAAQELNLIDFDGDAGTNGSSSATASAAASSQAQPGGLEDDLLGLSLGDSGAGSSFGQTGGISLGFGNNTSKWRAFMTLSPKPFVQSPDSSPRCARTGSTLVSDPGELRSRHSLNVVPASSLFCLFCVQFGPVRVPEQHSSTSQLSAVSFPTPGGSSF